MEPLGASMKVLAALFISSVCSAQILTVIDENNHLCSMSTVSTVEIPVRVKIRRDPIKTKYCQKVSPETYLCKYTKSDFELSEEAWEKSTIDVADKVTVCCPGYSNVTIVTAKWSQCKFGLCVAPNQCACFKGFGGDDCSDSENVDTIYLSSPDANTKESDDQVVLKNDSPGPFIFMCLVLLSLAVICYWQRRNGLNNNAEDVESARPRRWASWKLNLRRPSSVMATYDARGDRVSVISRNELDNTLPSDHQGGSIKGPQSKPVASLPRSWQLPQRQTADDYRKFTNTLTRQGQPLPSRSVSLAGNYHPASISSTSSAHEHHYYDLMYADVKPTSVRNAVEHFENNYYNQVKANM